MIYIFLSGFLGFCVFDAYRIRRHYDETGVFAPTFRWGIGTVVHGAVYAAAGVMALVVNFDVLGSCCNFEFFPRLDGNLAGPVLRGFGLGLAGPAGLARYRTSSAAVSQREGADFGELGSHAPLSRRAMSVLKTLLMR